MNAELLNLEVGNSSVWSDRKEPVLSDFGQSEEYIFLVMILVLNFSIFLEHRVCILSIMINDCGAPTRNQAWKVNRYILQGRNGQMII